MAEGRLWTLSGVLALFQKGDSLCYCMICFLAMASSASYSLFLPSASLSRSFNSSTSFPNLTFSVQVLTFFSFAFSSRFLADPLYRYNSCSSSFTLYCASLSPSLRAGSGRGVCPEHCEQREVAVVLGWILEISSPERNDGFMFVGLISGLPFGLAFKDVIKLPFLSVATNLSLLAHEE